MRLCRDCKHLLPEDRCAKSPQPIDYVSGKDMGYFHAQTERLSFGGCGEVARWFEPKVKEPLV